MKNLKRPPAAPGFREYMPRQFKWERELEGISTRTLEIHEGQLYRGYVKKANEIHERLSVVQEDIRTRKAAGNSTYSELRGLKEGETYAVNGIYLHEWYFEGLREPETTPVDPATVAPELSAALAAEFGNVETFRKLFTQCAMSARGWTILAWDARAQHLAIYNCDAHNQGGVWGALPVIVLDVYEHAYFIDHDGDRAPYIEAFWKNFDWEGANQLFKRYRNVQC